MRKGLDKNIHLVVEFLESGEFHGHTLINKEANPLVSQITIDDFREPTTRMGGFLVSYYPLPVRH
jgi:hypothetical protein